jgi:nucleoid DNA-binding protein
VEEQGVQTTNPDDGRTKGLDLVVDKVKDALELMYRKDAKETVDTVISCIEETLKENLGTNGFSIKLNSLGKLTVRHRAASLRKIPLTGETKMTSKKQKVKFITLGDLRRMEKVTASQETEPLITQEEFDRQNTAVQI